MCENKHEALGRVDAAGGPASGAGFSVGCWRAGFVFVRGPILDGRRPILRSLHREVQQVSAICIAPWFDLEADPMRQLVKFCRRPARTPRPRAGRRAGPAAHRGQKEDVPP